MSACQGSSISPWPALEGELAALIQRHPWNSTSLGPTETWSQSLRTAVEIALATPFPMLLVWGKELVQIYNDPYIEILGTKHPVALGQPTWACWPELWHMNESIYRRVLSGQTVMFEDRLLPVYRYWRREDAWFTISHAPLRDDHSQVMGVLATVIETTSRHVAQDALQESERRFRALVAASSYSTYRISPDWRTIRELKGSDTASEQLDVATEWISRFVDLQDQTKVLREIQMALQTQKSFEFEHRFQKPDGTLGWAVSHAVPLFTKDGTLAEWFGATSDVTARKRAELLLQSSERRQRFLLKLTDATRKLSKPGEILQSAAQLLCEELAAGGVIYGATADPDDGPALVCAAGGFASADAAGIFEHIRSTQAAGLCSGRTIVIEAAHRAGGAGVAPSVKNADLAEGALLVIPLVKDGGLAAMLIVGHRTSRDWDEQVIALAEEVAQRVWFAAQRAIAHHLLLASEERFRQFGEASTDVLWIRDAHDLQLQYLSPAFESVVGVSREGLLDRGGLELWRQLIHPEDRHTVMQRMGEVRAGTPLRHQFRVLRPQDAAIRWIDSNDFPILDERGAVRRIAGIAQDITSIKRSSRRLQVLVAELQHRTRNILAVVQGVCNSTLRASTGLEDFRHRFASRLGSLARANGLLSRSDSSIVTFDELIRAELAGMGVNESPSGGPKVTLSGPSHVQLRPSAVQILALAVHELITNALKHGAFSCPQGHVSITWQVTGNEPPQLQIDWVETGRPGPSSHYALTARKGFGSELIEKALPHQLEAQTQYVIGAEDVRCRIVLPLKSRGPASADADEM